ncbi:hypothetical protein AMELA_G00242230, partial [Ameiurus melas]
KVDCVCSRCTERERGGEEDEDHTHTHTILFQCVMLVYNFSCIRMEELFIVNLLLL